LLLLLFDLLFASTSILLFYNFFSEGIQESVENIYLEIIIFNLIVIGVFAYIDSYNYLVFLNRFRYVYRTLKGIGYTFVFYLGWLWVSNSLHTLNVYAILMLFFIFSLLTYFSRMIIIPLFSMFLPRRKMVLYAPEGNYKNVKNWIDGHTVSGINITKILRDKEEIGDYVEKGYPVIISTFTKKWKILIDELFYFKGKVPVILYSPLLAGIDGVDYWGYFEGVPIVYFRWSGESQIYRIGKKLIDITGTILAIILFAPFMIIAAIGIKLTSRGSVFFIQERVGRGGKVFKMIKFRSMHESVDDEPHKEFMKDCINGSSEKVFKYMDDERITPWGKVLRKTSIDEIPQFFNVLKGDLSLVGPRPPLDYEVKQYSDWHGERLSVKQGISGVWQVFGRARLPFVQSCFLDIYYVENKSLCLDIHLLAQTPQAIVLGKGAY